MNTILRRCGLLAAALGMTVAAPATAQDFYQGKTIRLITGSQPGISYYIYAQTIAPYLRKHIAGNPTVIVQNMIGAGGVIAANHVYNVAEKDGTVVGMFNRGTVLSAIVGHAQTKFKPQDVYWLGTTASFADNAYLLIVRAALPHKSVADLRKPGPPIVIGDSGSPPVLVLQQVLGFNVK